MQRSDKQFLDNFSKMYMREINNPTNAERLTILYPQKSVISRNVFFSGRGG